MPGRSRLVLAGIGTLGLTAAVAQLALFRELLGAASGNELTLGVSLGCWLSLTAVGTWLGGPIGRSRHPSRLLAVALVAASLLPLAAVLGLRGLRDRFYLRGAELDPIATILVCALVLGPFCIASGMLLGAGSRVLQQAGLPGATGRVYAMDSVGAIVGAAVFTFGLGPHVDHAALLCWPVAVCCGFCALVGWRRRAGVLIAVGVAGMVTMAAAGLWDGLDRISTAWQHTADVVYRGISPYGRLVVTQRAGQLTFYENGAPVLFTANAVATEEIAHYALAQRANARSVLLIGGAVAGVGRDVFRHPGIREITAVELDPRIVSAGRKLVPENMADPRMHLITGDGRQFVLHTKQRFDAVLIALPDPSTFQLNRFYTAEFFAAVHRVLQPGGVLAFATGRYENYLSVESRQLIASAHATADGVFRHVAVIPGTRVFFIASDRPLRRDIAEALESEQVEPAYVNRHFLDAMLTPDRLTDIDGAARGAAPVNSDLRPVLSLLELRYWLSQYRFPAFGLLAAFGLLLAMGIVRLAPVPRMIFAGGFAGSALELTLLVTVQVCFGALYYQLGVLVTTFMVGLAAGAMLGLRSNPRSPRTVVRILGAALAGLALLFAVALPTLATLAGQLTPAPIALAAILVLTLAVAAAIGGQFTVAAKAGHTAGTRTAPRLFSADLLGAALAAVVVSTFVLPGMGLTAVCVITAGLNGLAAALSSAAHGRT
ncbi:MAG TPA: hypothetical protein VHE61_24710 [Opitutaceae bacterium]|nr:hypothetical protein [Opitutaceae bacterium]